MSIRIIRGLHDPHDRARGSAVTIGAFDGVHRGHQAVLAALVGQAQALDAEATVVTFEPLPREYFMGDDAPPRLQSLRDKVAALAQYGVTRVMCVPFDAEIAALDAEAFVRVTLVDALAARAVLVGDDFRFGRDRTGDLALLRELGGRYGFTAASASTHRIDGERVSSTRIRELLAGGEPGAAAAMIGRPYAVSGRVRRGDALGRKLGFATANLEPPHRLALAHGVYAANVVRADGSRHLGAAHWGPRGRLEVHLLDFVGDLYGELITVELLEYIREDRKFDNLDQLRGWIAQDVEKIRWRTTSTP